MVFPSILSTLPANKAPNVSLTAEILIQFSEKMNRQSVEEALYISPVISYKLKWKGNALNIKPEASLKQDQTYVVSLGPGCQDLQGNRLSSTFTFAFSTGVSLDTGSISGFTVQDGKLQSGISVWAYRLNNRAETILPWERKPDYATQSGQDGTFRLDYLGAGKYGVFAVKDMNRNLLWDPAAEPLGISYREVNLDSLENLVEGLSFVLANRDTTSLALLNCQMLDRYTIKLSFSKNLSVQRTDKIDIRLISASGETLIPEKIYQVKGQEKSIFLQMKELIPQTKYILKIVKLFSNEGTNIQENADSCQFVATDAPDIVPPEIAAHYPVANASSVPLDSNILLYFSELMDEKLNSSRFTVEDSAGQGIIGNLSWLDELTLNFAPAQSLFSDMKYEVKIYRDLAMDLAGNFLKDSLISFSFKTLDTEKTGSVTGGVRFSRDKFLGKITLDLAGLDNNEHYQSSLSSGDTFTFTQVMPGNYTLSGFVDFDENGAYSFGNVQPFTPAEPFAIHPDTILVRSRWTTEGITLEF